MAILQFDHKGRLHFLTFPDDANPDEIKHQYLLSADPAYKWLSFRRALLSTSAYQDAVAMGLGAPNIGLSITLLASAVDACCSYGAEPDEVLAFLSAVDLLKSQLPAPEGDSICSRLDALILEYQL